MNDADYRGHYGVNYWLPNERAENNRMRLVLEDDPVLRNL